MTSVILLILLLFPGASAKKRDWVPGKITDLNHTQKTEFSPVAAGRDPMGGTAIARVIWNYTIESDSMRYEVEKSGEDFPFNQGSAVQFAIEKKDLILLDSKNKEVRGKITKSTPLKKP